MKSILWVAWHPTPYNDFLFAGLNKYFKVEVIYLSQKLSSHPWNYVDQNLTLSWNNKKHKSTIGKILLNAKFDIVVITGWDHPLTFLSSLYFILLKKKYCILSDTPKLKKKRSLLKRIYNSIFVSTIVNKAEAILVTGFVGVRNFKAIYGSQLNIINFPFTTDINFFKPDPLNEKYGVPTIITVGRLLNSHKGMDVAVAAIHEIVKRNSIGIFKLLIIGAGPDKQIITEDIRDRQLSTFIEIVDWKEPHELVCIYQKCKIYIHPSHFDPYPNSVLEAMACGLPVVGSDGAGSAVDRVIDGINGYVFPDGDFISLANHIETLLRDDIACNQFGQEARKTAEKWKIDFNINQMDRLIETTNSR